VEERQFARTNWGLLHVLALLEHQAMLMLELAYLLRLNVSQMANVQKTKNAVSGNVFACLRSSQTIEMETDVKARATNSDAALMQNVHLQIHRNVCVRLDIPEIL
jgi:hypothetical protein